MTGTHIEHDSMGELAVPTTALYGAQTQYAVNNFSVSGQRMPQAFVRTLLLAKVTATRANVSLQQLDVPMGEAITETCLQLLQGNFMKHFLMDVFQIGSGTSSNINTSEVMATLASRRLGGKVNPNDHVNCGQSNNGIILSTIHISAALEISEHLLSALRHLEQTVQSKASEVRAHVRTDHTHLVDTIPVRMSQVLGDWAQQVRQAGVHTESVLPALQQLAQGDTVVGTGINAHPRFAECFSQELNDLTGLAFRPGEVNPVIPETTAMVAAQVIGNGTAIAVAGQSGNFELDVMLSLVASNLLHSTQLLANVSRLLADKAIASFRVNRDRLNEMSARNPILITTLNPIIGYQKAAEIAKQVYREERLTIDVTLENTDLDRTRLEVLLGPEKLMASGP